MIGMVQRAERIYPISEHFQCDLMTSRRNLSAADPVGRRKNIPNLSSIQKYLYQRSAILRDLKIQNAFIHI